jgi:hypothetical protein
MRSLSASLTALAALLALALGACKPEVCPLEWTHEYAETQCADPWQRGSDDTQTQQNITQYLAEQGIAVIQIEIEVIDEGPFCAACTCGSGRLIRVEVAEEDSAGLAALGWTAI